MNPGDIVKIHDPYPHHPHFHKPKDPYGKLGVVVKEVEPRLPGGPTQFRVFVEDSTHIFAIHALEMLM